MQMKKRRLLFDVDGPLTEGFVDFVCKILNENGVRADPAQVRHWDPMMSFDTPAHVRAIVNQALVMPNVVREFVPRAGAAELLRWARQHAAVYAVTSPWDSPHWMPERSAWLVEHFGFSHKQISHIHDKFIVVGDVLVDDKHANVKLWQEEYPDGLAVLWRMGHNRDDAWPVEVSSCDELQALLAARWGVE